MQRKWITSYVWYSLTNVTNPLVRKKKEQLNVDEFATDVFLKHKSMSASMVVSFCHMSRTAADFRRSRLEIALGI